jgi:membrane peptidoglycan carboxypeptidase
VRGDTLGQIIVAALVLGNSALAYLNRRDIKSTKTMVDGQHTAALNRETQLTATIANAGLPVPPHPVEKVDK